MRCKLENDNRTIFHWPILASLECKKKSVELMRKNYFQIFNNITFNPEDFNPSSFWYHNWMD